MEAKFKTGDKVRVIKYGSCWWCSKKGEQNISNKWPIIFEDEDFIFYDPMSELVGKEGIVEKATETQGKIQYVLQGIEGKSAWYSEKQLELV